MDMRILTIMSSLSIIVFTYNAFVCQLYKKERQFAELSIHYPELQDIVTTSPRFQHNVAMNGNYGVRISPKTVNMFMFDWCSIYHTHPYGLKSVHTFPTGYDFNNYWLGENMKIPGRISEHIMKIRTANIMAGSRTILNFDQYFNLLMSAIVQYNKI